MADPDHGALGKHNRGQALEMGRRVEHHGRGAREGGGGLTARGLGAYRDGLGPGKVELGKLRREILAAAGEVS